jgi:hypothetical protein
MKHIFTLGALCVAIFSLAMPSASAYELVSTESRRLDADHTLYMITYKAGFLNREAEFPVTATRKATSTMSVVYQFENASGTVPATSGISASTIVSDAEKQKGVYPLTRGKNQLFTLIVVRYGTERLTPEAMRITKIPYVLIDGKERAKALMSKDQIEDHITDYVK